MKKALSKRMADVLEEMFIGSAIIGIFQQNNLGIYIGIGCFVISFI